MKELYSSKPDLAFLAARHLEEVVHFDIGRHRAWLAPRRYVDHSHHNLLEIKDCVEQTYLNVGRPCVECALVFRIVETGSLRYCWKRS